jgi:hypothetical protein
VDGRTATSDDLINIRRRIMVGFVGLSLVVDRGAVVRS